MIRPTMFNWAKFFLMLNQGGGGSGVVGPGAAPTQSGQGSYTWGGQSPGSRPGSGGGGAGGGGSVKPPKSGSGGSSAAKKAGRSLGKRAVKKAGQKMLGNLFGGGGGGGDFPGMRKFRKGLNDFIITALTNPESLGVSKQMSSMIADQLATRQEQLERTLRLRLSPYSGAYAAGYRGGNVNLMQQGVNAQRQMLFDVTKSALSAGAGIEASWLRGKGMAVSGRRGSGGLFGKLGQIAALGSSIAATGDKFGWWDQVSGGGEGPSDSWYDDAFDQAYDESGGY